MNIRGKAAREARRASHAWGWLCAAAAACWLAGVGTPAASARPTDEIRPRPIADIIGLDDAAVAAASRGGHGMRIRGVVTVRRPAANGFFVQDDSGGIYARAVTDDLELPGSIVSGMEVEVEGIPARGGYAPTLAFRRVVPLAATALPEPLPTDAARLYRGADHCRLVEITAVVQGVRRDGDNWLITAENGDRIFTIECLEASTPALAGADPPGAAQSSPDRVNARLVNAVVRAVGVANVSFNTRGEMLRPRVLVPRGDMLTVVTPAENDPFESPRVSLDGLARYHPRAAVSSMVRVEGVVVHAMPGEAIWLQEGPHGLFVSTRSVERFAVGDRVEVCGFPRTSGRVTSLAEGMVRRVGRSQPVEPLAVTPDEIIAVNARAAASGLIAEPGDYDGCLIRFRGRLFDRQPSPVGGRLLVAAGRSTVAVKADRDLFAAVAHLQPESELELTGLVEIGGQEDRDRWPLAIPDHMNLVPRSAADVVLVRGPPWWTPARLAAALAAGGGILAAALLWVVLLRRQVGRQLSLIEAAVEERAIVEERRRIAREFHDSLEQDLANVSLQLDAAASFAAGDSRALLEQQRSLVVRLQRETRQFVWDLRDPSRGSWSFADLLAEQCREQQAAGGLPIDLVVEGSFAEPPRVARYHLQKIARESVANAMRHAGATCVTVRLAGGTDGLRLDVTDDGHGFELERGEWRRGHFGIRGMRERAARIGAEITIDTAPGRGTRVSVRMPAGREA